MLWTKINNENMSYPRVGSIFLKSKIAIMWIYWTVIGICSMSFLIFGSLLVRQPPYTSIWYSIELWNGNHTQTVLKMMNKLTKNCCTPFLVNNTLYAVMHNPLFSCPCLRSQIYIPHKQQMSRVNQLWVTCSLGNLHTEEDRSINITDFT